MKQKIHKLSIALSIIGIFVIIASTVRWFFLFPDYSQFAIAIGIGVGIIGFAYIHEAIKRIDEQIKEFDHALNGFDNYYWNEIDKLKDKIGVKK